MFIVSSVAGFPDPRNKSEDDRVVRSEDNRVVRSEDDGVVRP